MTHDDLSTLLDFHYWARDRVLDAVATLSSEQYTRDLGSSFPSVRDTLVHLFSSERTWYQRWLGHSPSAMLDPRDFPDLETLRAAWSEHEGRKRAYLASMTEDDVHGVVEYRGLQGQEYASAMWEMWQHVVNHGTYHRGQVQTMLRQLGAAPAPGVDIIVYHRQRRGRQARPA